MVDPIAAAIAFFALGGTLLGGALLLLFNPRGRSVRWFTLFNAALVGWLLSQAMRALEGSGTGWDTAHFVSAMLLPAIFFASAWVQESERPTWHAVAILAGAVLLLPVLLFEVPPILPEAYARVFVSGWQVAGWLGGVLLLKPFRGAKVGPPAAAVPGSARARRRADGIVISTLLSLVPISVAAAMLLGSARFFFYVLPLAVVGVQFLIFVGVIRHRFYDIEVRAARTGELATRAAERERLAVVGELAASIAHEVRNPLTGVRSLAQRLAEDDVDIERRRRYAGIILDEAARVERIVSNLLGVARMAPPTCGEAVTPLAPVFEDLLLLTGSRAKGANVTIAASAGGSAAAGVSRESLSQALLNLLLNAIAHSPPGGRIELLAREGASGIEIVVRDQGPGVPKSERERIFEPFYSAAAHGAGLGLSVVRRLSRTHGWDLSVDDAPGGGAEFRLGLPGGGTAAQGETGEAVAACTS